MVYAQSTGFFNKAVVTSIIFNSDSRQVKKSAWDITLQWYNYTGI